MLTDRFGCVQVASTTLFKPRLRPTLGRVMAATPAGAYAVDMAFGFALAFAAPLAVSTCWEVRVRVGLTLGYGMRPYHRVSYPTLLGTSAPLPMPTGNSV